MYSLHLTCAPGDVDALSTRLWERGTAGIREIDQGEDETVLIAGFETNEQREEMLQEFAAYSPDWQHEDATDWVAATHLAWPPREVGDRIFLAPPWSTERTPPGRLRIIHNPGLACGTGEHPCTQLALEALERHLNAAATVVDVGTGSAILAIAAMRLGADRVVGTDLDIAALQAAQENFELNGFSPALACGSADCIRDSCADVTVANISGTVLMSIMEDLMRMTKRDGKLILTGFPESELQAFRELFPNCKVTAMNEWRCVVTTLFS